jgi:antitoxin component of RelBE/YafQ-DinJ toxin-antitoxin module
MVLKTFNLDDETYKKFSEFCKENGISMSKQVNFFIQSQMAEEPEVREEYLKKLEKIRKGKFVRVTDFKKRYLS